MKLPPRENQCQPRLRLCRHWFSRGAISRGWHWFSRGDNFTCYPLVQSIFISYLVCGLHVLVDIYQHCAYINVLHVLSTIKIERFLGKVIYFIQVKSCHKHKYKHYRAMLKLLLKLYCLYLLFVFQKIKLFVVFAKI